MLSDHQMSLLDMPGVQNTLVGRRRADDRPSFATREPEPQRSIERSARPPAVAAWIALALGRLKTVAQDQPTLTADDVWATISEPPPAVEGKISKNHGRVMGAVFRKAKSLGWIAATGQWVRSERVEVNHGRVMRVWRSRLFSREQAGRARRGS